MSDKVKAKYRVNFYELDLPVAANSTGTWSAIVQDGRVLKLEAEEHPGLLHDRDVTLDPPEFDVLLWKPVVTDVPYSNAFAGLTREERRMLWDRRLAMVRRKMKQNP